MCTGSREGTRANPNLDCGTICLCPKRINPSDISKDRGVPSRGRRSPKAGVGGRHTRTPSRPPPDDGGRAHSLVEALSPAHLALAVAVVAPRFASGCFSSPCVQGERRLRLDTGAHRPRRCRSRHLSDLHPRPHGQRANVRGSPAPRSEGPDTRAGRSPSLRLRRRPVRRPFELVWRDFEGIVAVPSERSRVRSRESGGFAGGKPDRPR